MANWISAADIWSIPFPLIARGRTRLLPRILEKGHC